MRKVIAKTVQRPQFGRPASASSSGVPRVTALSSRIHRLARAGVPQPELLVVFAILYATSPDNFAARCRWDVCSAYCRICSTEALKAGGVGTPAPGFSVCRNCTSPRRRQDRRIPALRRRRNQTMSRAPRIRDQVKKLMSPANDETDFSSFPPARSPHRSWQSRCGHWLR
jgi:hypothetical protein